VKLYPLPILLHGLVLSYAQGHSINDTVGHVRWMDDSVVTSEYSYRRRLLRILKLVSAHPKLSVTKFFDGFGRSVVQVTCAE